MAGEGQKPDFIVEPSGDVRDVRHEPYGSPPGPPDAPPRDNGAGRASPSSPRKPARSVRVIWIPIGLILSLLALLVRSVLVSQSDGSTFTSERAYTAFQAGTGEYYSGAYRQAIQHYDTALSYESGVGAVYNGRALAYHALGEYDRALADYEQALELMPESGMVYNNRALVYLATGQVDLAIADLDQAIALQTNFGKAYYNRGLAYQALGDYERAIADLTQAVEFSDEQSLLRSSLSAEQSATLERVLSSEVDAQMRATQVRVDLPSALYQRGLCYLLTGEVELALADLKEAAELSPDIPGLPEALAVAYATGAETPSAPASSTPPPTPTATPTPTPPVRAISLGAWENIGLVGEEVTALAVDPVAPTTLYAGLADGRLFKSTDDGENWIAAGAGLGTGRIQALAIDPEAPTTLYACTASGLFKSTDGGSDWTNDGLPRGNVTSLVVDPQTPASLYIGSDGDGVYKSADGGATWHTANTGLDPPQVLSLAIDPQMPDTLYAGTHDYTHPANMRYYPGNLYKSTDGGVTWKSLTWGYVHYGSLAIDPLRPTTLYAGTTGGVDKSTDGGETWHAANRGLPGPTVYVLALDPGRPLTLYAGTSYGVYVSGDGGMSWSPVNAGLTNPEVSSLAIVSATPSVVYAGTRGGGVFVLQQVEAP